jgi:hypothetical protein
MLRAVPYDTLIPWYNVFIPPGIVCAQHVLNNGFLAPDIAQRKKPEQPTDGKKMRLLKIGMTRLHALHGNTKTPLQKQRN